MYIEDNGLGMRNPGYQLGKKESENGTKSKIVTKEPGKRREAAVPPLCVLPSSPFDIKEWLMKGESDGENCFTFSLVCFGLESLPESYEISLDRCLHFLKQCIFMEPRRDARNTDLHPSFSLGEVKIVWVIC